MRTTIAVDAETRDKLAELSRSRGAASIDALLQDMLFDYECRMSLAQMDADPQALAEYRAEALQWAELDVEVSD